MEKAAQPAPESAKDDENEWVDAEMEKEKTEQPKENVTITGMTVGEIVQTGPRTLTIYRKIQK